MYSPTDAGILDKPTSRVAAWQPELPARPDAVRRILQRALLWVEFQVSLDASTVTLRRLSSVSDLLARRTPDQPAKAIKVQLAATVVTSASHRN